MLNFDVKRKINTLRDILVGKVPDPKAQVEQITIALIYKFMDDMDLAGAEFGGKRVFFAGDYEKYAFTQIMLPEHSSQDRLNLYAEGIEKMVNNAELPQLFRDILRGAYIPYRDPETLNRFLKEIAEFNYDHSEDLGDSFEYLLSIMGSQGDAGQFRTPRHIIDMMVEIIAPRKNETVLDPACGTAGFLISAYKYIDKQNRDEEGKSTLSGEDRKRMADNFAGYDISPDMVRLSRVNMYLHGFSNPQISEYDTLTSLDKWDDTYDVILANPPFMTPKGGISPHNRYRVSAKRAEVLFVDYIAEHLTPTGRAAIVVPEGIVFQSQTAYKNLRRFLVEDNLLYAVISLPAGVFNPYSGVKTSILLIDKTLAKERNNILFVKLNNDGYDLGAQRREIKGSEIHDVINVLKDYQAGNFDVTQSNAVVVSKTAIAAHDYVLVGERYVINDQVDTKWPLIKIGDFCMTASGGTPKSSVREYYENGTINWLKSGEVANGYIYSTESKITEAGLDNSSAKLFPINTVLVAMYGATAGQVGLLKVPSTTNQAICGIYPNDRINPEFLYELLRSKRDYFLSVSTGGAQPNISQTIIKNFAVPLPPLSVQEEIVAEIKSYQRIVDGAKQVVSSYKPGVQVDPDWEKTTIGCICQLNPLKSETKDIPSDTMVSFVPMADIKENEMLFIPQTTKKLHEVYNGYTYFRNDDVLLAKVTPCFENGKSAIARSLENGIGFGSSEFYVLRPNITKVLPEFLYYTICSRRFLDQGKQHMSGTGGLQRLTKEYLLSYPISIPPIDVQQEIIKSIDIEMAIIEQNKHLIEIFEKKTKDRIAEVWGE